MGGMAAQIPIKNDAEANDKATRQSARRQSSARQATATTARGSRIPGLVAIAKQIFDKALNGKPNQIDKLRRRR